MLQLEVGKLLNEQNCLTAELAWLSEGWKDPQQRPRHLKIHDMEQIRHSVNEVVRIASNANLTSTLQAARRTKETLDRYVFPNAQAVLIIQSEQCGTLYKHLSDIVSRIRDDCEAHTYFQIEPENV